MHTPNARTPLLSGALTLVLALMGCAGSNFVEGNIPYVRAAAGDIRTVAILTPNIEGEAWSNEGFLAGAKAGRVDAALIRQHFSPREEFLQRLERNLRTHGYDVVYFEDKPCAFCLLRNRYPTQVGADALLDIWGYYGYFRPRIGDTPFLSDTPLRPIVYLEIRMVRTKNSSVLMQKHVQYGGLPAMIPDGFVQLSWAEPRTEFADFGEIEQNPQRAADGLRDGVDRAADAVAELLM